jgi:hypothetical protein
LPTELPQCKIRHSTAESLVLPAATDTVETTLGESYAKGLRKIPLAYNNMEGEYRIFQKTFMTD